MKKYPVFNYLALSIIITVVFVVIYATVQQTYRTAANDPQIQMARDISAKLQKGKSIENFFTDTIDIAESLSSFTVFYNADGRAIRSSGFLDDNMPKLPAGVFNNAKVNGEHDVTWHPQEGVRMAMVLVHTKSLPVSYVACGRSLKETEVREGDLMKMLFMGWIVCVALILFMAGLNIFSNRNKNKIMLKKM
jgi:hypothetical protein